MYNLHQPLSEIKKMSYSEAAMISEVFEDEIRKMERKMKQMESKIRRR